MAGCTKLLITEAAEGAHPQRVSARQKLARLNGLQFHELAMDVYDELVRRNLNDKQGMIRLYDINFMHIEDNVV